MGRQPSQPRLQDLEASRLGVRGPPPQRAADPAFHLGLRQNQQTQPPSERPIVLPVVRRPRRRPEAFLSGLVRPQKVLQPAPTRLGQAHLLAFRLVGALRRRLPPRRRSLPPQHRPVVDFLLQHRLLADFLSQGARRRSLPLPPPPGKQLQQQPQALASSSMCRALLLVGLQEQPTHQPWAAVSSSTRQVPLPRPFRSTTPRLKVRPHWYLMSKQQCRKRTSPRQRHCPRSRPMSYMRSTRTDGTRRQTGIF